MGYTVRSMRIEDYDEAVQLWQETEWISLSDTDAREPMRLFLDRNPGLSLIVRDGRQLIGTFLCSHAAGNFTHRNEQGEGAVLFFDGLVGDVDRPCFHECPRLLLISRQVQVGENNLAFTDKVVF